MDKKPNNWETKILPLQKNAITKTKVIIVYLLKNTVVNIHKWFFTTHIQKMGKEKADDIITI